MFATHVLIIFACLMLLKVLNCFELFFFLGILLSSMLGSGALFVVQQSFIFFLQGLKNIIRGCFWMDVRAVLF